MTSPSSVTLLLPTRTRAQTLQHTQQIASYRMRIVSYRMRSVLAVAVTPQTPPRRACNGTRCNNGHAPAHTKLPSLRATRSQVQSEACDSDGVYVVTTATTHGTRPPTVPQHRVAHTREQRPCCHDTASDQSPVPRHALDRTHTVPPSKAPLKTVQQTKRPRESENNTQTLSPATGALLRLLASALVRF